MKKSVLVTVMLLPVGLQPITTQMVMKLEAAAKRALELKHLQVNTRND